MDNPWWEAGRIPADLDALQRRDHFPAFARLVMDRRVRRAVVLMGPRRVGKTVMIAHLVQRLIAAGTAARRILYVSLDTPLYNHLPLERLLTLFRETHGHAPDAPLFVFFDEVQYLRDWQIHLKSLVDTYRHARFVASGSAAAALQLKSRESGAGRFTDFPLPALTFNEYLRFIGDAALVENHDGAGQDYRSPDIAALNRRFVDYINFGGYPEAVTTEPVRERSARFIRSDIIDKVLLRDLPSLYGIGDIPELNSLFTTLAFNSGGELSLEALSTQSGVAKNTIRKYLEYLSAAFLLMRVDRIDRQGRRFQRAVTFKTYLTNPALRSALFGPVTDTDRAMGRMAETAIFSQWFHSELVRGISYARWDGGEVDMVGIGFHARPAWAVEIKWSDRLWDKPEEIAPLIAFCRANRLGAARVTTLTRQGSQRMGGIDVHFTPTSVYCCGVGRNLLAEMT